MFKMTRFPGNRRFPQNGTYYMCLMHICLWVTRDFIECTEVHFYTLNSAGMPWMHRLTSITLSYICGAFMFTWSWTSLHICIQAARTATNADIPRRVPLSHSSMQIKTWSQKEVIFQTLHMSLLQTQNLLCFLTSAAVGGCLFNLSQND